MLIFSRFEATLIRLVTNREQQSGINYILRACLFHFIGRLYILKESKEKTIAMKTQEITIQVAPEAADIYQSSSEEKKRKLDTLLSVWLSKAGKITRSLKEVRHDASKQAGENGLTLDILSDILNE
jgi:hypothetical protein